MGVITSKIQWLHCMKKYLEEKIEIKNDKNTLHLLFLSMFSSLFF